MDPPNREEWAIGSGPEPALVSPVRDYLCDLRVWAKGAQRKNATEGRVSDGGTGEDQA